MVLFNIEISLFYIWVSKHFLDLGIATYSQNHKCFVIYIWFYKHLHGPRIGNYWLFIFESVINMYGCRREQIKQGSTAIEGEIKEDKNC